MKLNLFDNENEPPYMWETATKTFLDYLHEGIITDIQQGFGSFKDSKRKQEMYNLLLSCYSSILELDSKG